MSTFDEICLSDFPVPPDTDPGDGGTILPDPPADLPAEYRIRVRHSVTTHEEDALNETGYLVTYEVVESSIPDLPIELFLFRRIKTQRIDQPVAEKDNFVTVCTISDVFEYPADTPDPAKPYFRKARVSGIVPTMTRANEILSRMEDLLTSLLRSIKLIYTSAVEVERDIKL